MKPEEKARLHIDQLLDDAGWKVQDYRDLNLGVSLGVAVRVFPLKSGPTDYSLCVESLWESALVVEGNIEEKAIPL